MVYKRYPSFRFDVVCINADMQLIYDITDFIKDHFKNDVEIIWGVSPLVHDMSECKGKHSERVFPEILNAKSDYRNFFNVDLCGIPPLRKDITTAGHGLIHVDHRLLSYGEQEMSIITSCSLVKAKHFIPPFNKWNSMTEAICREHSIELIKFESGWLSMEHNQYDKNHGLYYLHAREWTMDNIKEWFNK